jgi:hypothetical protein
MTDNELPIEYYDGNQEKSYPTSSDLLRQGRLELSQPDSVIIVGKDQAEAIEADVTNCGLITIYNREKQVAGIIHISILAEQELINELVDSSQHLLQQQQLTLDKMKLEIFNIGDTLTPKLQEAFKRYDIETPKSQLMGKSALRIYKDTGEIIFVDPE